LAEPIKKALNHTKRTMEFNHKMAALAVKVMGVSTADERKEIARILLEQTTDSRCMVRAKSEEPIFVLRAKDPIAKIALAEWIVESKKAGLHKDKMDDAMACLQLFKTYKVEN
jgi:hypothetical protein